MSDDRLDAKASAALYGVADMVKDIRGSWGTQSQAADYKRGWNDAMDHIKQAMTRL